MTTPLSVLHVDAGWVAINKPAGALVIPGRGEDEAPAIRQQLEAQLGRPVWVVHRLDRDTSGVLLFALDAPTHRALSMAFEAGRIEKRYWALVEGRVDAPLELTDALSPARRGRMRIARTGDPSKPAQTRVRPLETFERVTLVEALPLTGRTHQIRVHLAAAGHPLLVDHQYGRPRPLTAAALGGEGDLVVLSRTPLHASSMAIPALEGVAAAQVNAPLAADFEAVMALLRS